MVGRAVICCLSDVDNELGHGCIRDERAVDGEKDALDGVELGWFGLRLFGDCVGFFLLGLGDESSLLVSWLRWSSGHSWGHQRQPGAEEVV